MAKRTDPGLAKKPNQPMIQITLTPKMQEALAPVLFKSLRLNETFGDTDMILIMRPHIFGNFIADCACLPTPPTLQQLKIEQIPDLRKLPHRYILRYEKMPYEDSYTIDR